MPEIVSSTLFSELFRPRSTCENVLITCADVPDIQSENSSEGEPMCQYGPGGAETNKDDIGFRNSRCMFQLVQFRVCIGVRSAHKLRPIEVVEKFRN